jgi:hypothetical protein
MAERIQRSRQKGWKMPEGAIYVGRKSRWGNPFDLGIIHHAAACGLTTYGDPAGTEAGQAALQSDYWFRACHRLAAEFYREYLIALPGAARAQLLEPLRGRDLACWCAPEFSCHADVLLELANPASAPQ